MRLQDSLFRPTAVLCVVTFIFASPLGVRSQRPSRRGGEYGGVGHSLSIDDGTAPIPRAVEGSQVYGYGETTPPPTTQMSESCTYALQLLLLQDISQSYQDDLPNLISLLPTFLEGLLVDYPHSLFSLATFSDYPMPNVGWAKYNPKDYCFNMDVGFTNDTDEILEAVKGLSVVSGLDEPEGQLTGLHHATECEYFNDRRDLHKNTRDVRLVALSTDADYHRPGDLAAEALKHSQYRRDRRMRTYFSSSQEYVVEPNDGDCDLQCSGYHLEDYPTVEQVAEALEKRDAGVLFLVTADQLQNYTELANQLKDHNRLAIVAEIDSDSNNIVDALNAGLREVYRLVCIDSTTTTTTTGTTTTTSTVTSRTTTATTATRTTATTTTATATPIVTTTTTATTTTATTTPTATPTTTTTATTTTATTTTATTTPTATPTTTKAATTTTATTTPTTTTPTTTTTATTTTATTTTATTTPATTTTATTTPATTTPATTTTAATTPATTTTDTTTTTATATTTAGRKSTAETAVQTSESFKHSTPEPGATETATSTETPGETVLGVGVLVGASSAAAAAAGAVFAAANSAVGAMGSGATAAAASNVAETQALTTELEREFAQDVTAEMFA